MPPPAGEVLVEACVATLDSAVQAERVGAQRIELCADLSRGGVTPSAGLIRAVRARVEVPLQVLVRPRAGDFRYDEGDREAMLLDIREARRSGADGVVVGALTRKGTVDRDFIDQLVRQARPLTVTFHRAVDQTPDPGAAVATLVELGIERVLTAGGAGTAGQGIPVLRRLVERFGASITILAGGGIRGEQAGHLVRLTAVREIHLGPRLPESETLDVQALSEAIQSVRR